MNGKHSKFFRLHGQIYKYWTTRRYGVSLCIARGISNDITCKRFRWEFVKGNFNDKNRLIHHTEAEPLDIDALMLEYRKYLMLRELVK